MSKDKNLGIWNVLKGQYKDKIINPIDLGLILKKENIIKERCDLYLDFLLTFFDTTTKSYLGHDYIKNDVDKKGHFTWCYDKTVNEFKEEGLNFDSELLKEYLWDYILFMIYGQENIPDFEFFEMNWKYIMEFSGVKTKKCLEEMIYMYKIFDEILDSKNK
jgi:hypothetical protein